MRLGRVIIGMDFSAGAMAAARWTARDLAPDAELVLAHCIAPRSSGPSLPRGAATARLQAIAADLAPARVRVAVRTGDPAEGLAAFAAELEADLVVIGPHDRRAESGEMGSTAERLVARSRTPVLLAVAVLQGLPRRVLVPVTGDDVSPAVLEWTRELEARSEVKLAVVHLAGPSRPRRGPWRASSATHRWPHLGDGCAPGAFFVDAAAGAPAAVVGENVERFSSDLVVLEGAAPSPTADAPLARQMGPFLREAPCAVLVTAAGKAASEFP